MLLGATGSGQSSLANILSLSPNQTHLQSNFFSIANGEKSQENRTQIMKIAESSIGQSLTIIDASEHDITD